MSVVAFASGDYGPQSVKAQQYGVTLTSYSNDRESEMYAPYRFPGASVKLVPSHATIPPPARAISKNNVLKPATSGEQLREVKEAMHLNSRSAESERSVP